jgi:hypothetical protein
MSAACRRIKPALPWLAWLALAGIGAWIFAADSGGDAHAYWAARGYGALADERDAFLYTPVFLQALWPFQLLPWEMFRVLWLAAGLATLGWLTGPVIAVLVLLPGPYSPVYTDIFFGNVMVFTAAVTVAGFRWPWIWAALPFAKVTPGAALLWPLLHRQWRPLLLAAGITALSVLVAFDLWQSWLRVLQQSVEQPPVGGLAGFLVLRIIVAAGFVLLGAWQGWRWTLPVAVLLTQPILWFSSFTMLLGWVWLLRDRDARSDRQAG